MSLFRYAIAGPSRSGLRGSAAPSVRLYSSCSSGSQREQRLLTCRPTPEQGDKDRSVKKAKRMAPTSSLAIRRASVFASQSARSASTSHHAGDLASAPLSSYLDTLRSPSGPNFEAVHLYPPQFARLQSTVPSYMPLPLHANKQHLAAELFVRPSEQRRQQNVLTQLASLRSTKQTALQGHLAIKHALEPEATSQESAARHNDFALLSLEHGDPETSGMAKAEQDWLAVLDQMNGKQVAAEQRAETEAAAAADLEAALAEVAGLLADLDLAPARRRAVKAVQAGGMMRKRTLRHLGGSVGKVQDRIRVGRWNVLPREADDVRLDSVQRKRRKKISKHKCVPPLVPAVKLR